MHAAYGHDGSDSRNNNGARHDHGVVPAADIYCDRRTVAHYGLLGLCYGRGRLDGGAEKDFGAVADAAENSARVVGLFDGPPVFRAEKAVIVFGTAKRCRTEAGAQLKALDGAYGKNSPGKAGIQLVKHRLIIEARAALTLADALLAGMGSRMENVLNFAKSRAVRD